MKKRNRILALLLTTVMLLGMLPGAAFATEAPPPVSEPSVSDSVDVPQPPTGDENADNENGDTALPQPPAGDEGAENDDALLGGTLAIPNAALLSATLNNVYVKTGGNDTSTGEDEANAVATLAKAYELVADNGTIHVVDNMTLDAAVTMATSKTVTIQGEGGSKTITRGASYITDSLFQISAGAVTLDNITIDGNKTNVTADKGLVYMTGGKLTVNANSTLQNSSSKFYGFAIYAKNATLDMKGTVTNNVGVGTGGAGAVFLDGGTTATITGSVTNNTASTTAGGVHVGGSGGAATVVFDGATITGNRASDTYHGGGVFSYGSVDSTVTIKGATKITGNTSVAANGADNLYMGANRTFALDTLATGANIGVYTETTPSDTAGTGDVKFATGATNDDVKYITSDNAMNAGIIRCDGASADTPLTSGGHSHTTPEGDLYLSTAAKQQMDVYVSEDTGADTNTGLSGSPLKTLAVAYDRVADRGTIHVMDPLTQTATVTMSAGKNITILSDDNDAATANDKFLIQRGSNTFGPMLTVSAGEVTLSNIVFDGNNTAVAAGANTTGISVTGGTLTMNAGSALQNSNQTAASSYSTGGVKVTGGTFNLAGGTITGNTGFDGAGVLLTGGTFTMTAGEISKNTATGYCGGVYSFGNARTPVTATITGGIIEGNFVSNTGTGGGGVMIHEYSTAKIGGIAKIINNGIANPNSTPNTAAAAGVWLYGTTNCTLTVGGNAQIVGNTIGATASGTGTGMTITPGTKECNVLLMGSQTVAVDSTHLTSPAQIGVNTKTVPTATGDVKIATGAVKDDAKYFLSDNAAESGVLFCDGTDDWIKGEQMTTNSVGHTHAANTLWLSVAARLPAPVVTGTTAKSITIKPDWAQAYSIDGTNWYRVKDGKLEKLTGETWGEVSESDATAAGLKVTTPSGNLTFTKNATGNLEKSDGVIGGNDTLVLRNKWQDSANPVTTNNLKTSMVSAEDIAKEFDPTAREDSPAGTDEVTGDYDVHVTIDPDTGRYVVTVKENIDVTVTIPDTWGEIDLDLKGKTLTGDPGQPGIKFVKGTPNPGTGTSLNIKDSGDDTGAKGGIKGGAGTAGAPGGTGGAGIGVAGSPSDPTGVKVTIEDVIVTGGTGGAGSSGAGGDGGEGIDGGVGPNGGIEVTVNPGTTVTGGTVTGGTGGDGGTNGSGTGGDGGEGGGGITGGGNITVNPGTGTTPSIGGGKGGSGGSGSTGGGKGGPGGNVIDPTGTGTITVGGGDLTGGEGGAGGGSDSGTGGEGGSGGNVIDPGTGTITVGGGKLTGGTGGAGGGTSTGTGGTGGTGGNVIDPGSGDPIITGGNGGDGGDGGTGIGGGGGAGGEGGGTGGTGGTGTGGNGIGGTNSSKLTSGTTSVTVNPTVTDWTYEIFDETGASVGTQTSTGSSITFTGLIEGKQYTVKATEPSPSTTVHLVGSIKTSTSSGGGGGTGGTSTGVTIPKRPGGGTTISPTNPKPGEDVIITITPDKGYVLDKLTVKDPKGNELTVTPMGGGKYKVTMPDPAVKLTVDATFKKLSNDPHNNGVSDLLNVDDHIAYMRGREGGVFAPGENMTRAEVAQMFYNLLKTQNTDLGGKASYNDVSADAWYAKAVNTLANIGIVNGVGGGDFAPERTITRAEFIAIAARFADVATGGNTFSDVPATHWAFAEITTATAYGWIEGYGDGSFKPGNNIARSEAVKVVNAMLSRSADKSFVDAAKELVTFPDVPKTDWAYYPIMEATNAHDFTAKDGAEIWAAK